MYVSRNPYHIQLTIRELKLIMKIIDTHAHLDHVPDVENALKRAYDAGVSDIVAVSTDLKAIKRNLELKRLASNPRIHTALGVHPGEIKMEELPETFQYIRSHISEAVAIGETGLDYWYKWVRKNEDERKKQQDCFREHLILAQEFNLPVVIHSRGAWRDCLDMTLEVGIKHALFHWYSGPVDVLADIIKEGFYVSCSPSLAYSPQSREAMTHAPVERTLIETDSPVFYNQPDEGFQAEPKDVWKTLKAYSELKNISQEEALARLVNNAKSFFRIQ